MLKASETNLNTNKNDYDLKFQKPGKININTLNNKFINQSKSKEKQEKISK